MTFTFCYRFICYSNSLVIIDSNWKGKRDLLSLFNVLHMPSFASSPFYLFLYLHCYASMTCPVSCMLHVIIQPSKPSWRANQAYQGLKGHTCLQQYLVHMSGLSASQQSLLMTCSQQIPKTLRWLPPTSLYAMMKSLR